MFNPRMAAARAGIRIELGDLGDWGPATLVSEYDPNGPVIRINARALDRYRLACAAQANNVQALVDFAVAHELYHHREALGHIDRLATQRERERAADAFARAAVAPDPLLDAFVNGRVS